MDFKFILTLLTIAVFIIIAQIIFVWQQLMRQRYKFVPLKVADLSGIDQKLEAVYNSAEEILFSQGFSLLHDMARVDIVAGIENYFRLYFHPIKKVYAEVKPRWSLTYPYPFHIEYQTFFTDGSSSITFDGVGDLILKPNKSTQISDGYFGNPNEQWNLHNESVEKILKGNNTSIIDLNIEEYIIRSEEDLHNDLTCWEKKYFYPPIDGYYTWRPYSALKFALSHIRSNNIGTKRFKIISKNLSINHNAIIQADKVAIARLLAMEKKPPVTNKWDLLLLIGSAFLFIIAFGLLIDWETSFIILGVITLHESGHWISMKLFKFNLHSIFFVPLLGAIIVGEKEDATPYQKLIAFLMGPLPGIIIATYLFFFNQYNPNPTILKISTICLFINYFNLLPITPLDGGRIVETFIQYRLPFGKLFFTAFSTLMLVFGAFLLKSPVLGVVAVIMAVNLKSSWYHYKSIKELKAKQTEIQDNDSLLDEIVSHANRNPAYRNSSMQRIRFAKSLYSFFRSTIPTLKQSIIGSLIYLSAFLSPIIIAILFLCFSAISRFLIPEYHSTETIETISEKLTHSSSTKERYDLFKKLGEFYQDIEESDSAAIYYQCALMSADSLNIKDDNYISILQSLATTDSNSININSYYKRALIIAEQLHGPAHSAYADVLTDYCTSSHSLLTDPQRITDLNRAIEIYSQMGQDHKYKIANIHLALSPLYEKSRQFASAESCFIKYSNYHTNADTLIAQTLLTHLLVDFYMRTNRDSLAQSIMDSYENKYSTLNSQKYYYFKLQILAHCGWIALARNDTARARKVFMSAYQIMSETGDPDYWIKMKFDCVLDLGYLNIYEGDTSAAQRVYETFKNKYDAYTIDAFVSAYWTYENSDEDRLYNWETARKNAHRKLLAALNQK